MVVRTLSVFVLAALVALGCSDDSTPVQEEGDVGVADDLGSSDLADGATADGALADMSDASRPGPGARVEIDLDEAVEGAGEGEARVFQVDDVSQLIEGPIAHGKIGDWILENDRARFLIEADDRVMNPCPYGGNVLDAAYLEGGSGEDNLGEICLFVNAGLTLKPERFEVVESAPNVAILAVTGSLVVSDFINVKSMVGEFLPGLADNLPLDPDRLVPVTTTIYYVLGAQDLGLRVISAFRNDGDEQVDLVPIHMVMSGGDGRYYNPLSANRGFGPTGREFEPDPVAFVGWRGEESSYLYLPEPSPLFTNTPIPAGGASITISGVTAVAVGLSDVLGVLLSRPERLAQADGVLHLMPDVPGSITHWHFVGDGALSTMLDEAYETIGVATTRVDGRVVDDGGNGIVNARVTAVDVESERSFTQTLSGPDGAFSFAVPADRTYEFLARVDRARYASVPPELEVSGATASVGDIEVVTPATLNVRIRRPDGSATPARVTVSCLEECPGAPTTVEKDLDTDRLPGGWAAVGWADVSGEISLELAPGSYQVAVTRGFEWSMWPFDAHVTGGEQVDLQAGDTVDLDAEIEHVVDTRGAMSADFHIHSLPSPDSVVPHRDRVLGFVAEGLDVMVSTDHDYISDFGPAISSLGAEAEVVSIMGSEITTSDIGHYNAFPLVRDSSQRRGGSIDWSPGEGPGLTPEQLFAEIRSDSGEKVIQANHPSGLGIVNSMIADPLRGMTFADRQTRRMPPAEPDPQTGDTGLWSDDFTAMEIMTGSSLGRFWGVGRWWLQMIGRGFTPTGTVVTDTHRRYSDLGGSPRSYVMLPEAVDSPLTFDVDAFVEAVNGGRVVGSRGPFMRVSATNEAGDIARISETVATNDAPVTVSVQIDLPEWMEVDEVAVFMNLRDEILTMPGEYVTDAWTPTTTVDVELDPETDLVEVSTGTQVHRHWTKTVEVEVETDVDAWVVVVVRGSGSMYPLVLQQTPFAFSNPIYLDADGGGYDNPPLADLADSPPPAMSVQRAVHGDHSHVQLTRQTLFEALTDRCSH